MAFYCRARFAHLSFNPSIYLCAIEDELLASLRSWICLSLIRIERSP